jgi:hypothetical protein
MLFSLRQEAKRKDIKRFFRVFKKKFNFFANPIRLLFLEERIAASYCCLILHNMSVLDRVEADDGIIENDSFYDVVGTPSAERVTQNVEALHFVRSQEQSINDRALENDFLNSLGINVVDNDFQVDVQCINALPQMIRMAEFRWQRLYDICAHTQLMKAIARELSHQYAEFRSRNN